MADPWIQSNFFVVTVATVILWLAWQYHASANLRARGVPDLRFTPAWAVGWWFVPLANLVVAYVAMRELERRSTRSGRPRSGSALLGWWWAVWLGWLLVPSLGVLAAIWPRLDSVTASIRDATPLDVAAIANQAAPWYAVAGVLGLVAAVLAFRVVGRIDEAQRRMEGAEVTPPRPDLPVG